MSGEYEDRKRLTFEQAEGAEPLATQLRSRELSPELRVLLWDVFYDVIGLADYPTLTNPWKMYLYRFHVQKEHKPADEFLNISAIHLEKLKAIFFGGDYLQVFGFVQWMLRQDRDSRLHEYVEEVFRQSRAGYAVFDRDTIVPIGSDAERTPTTTAMRRSCSSKIWQSVG